MIKTIAVATVLMATALAGILSTNPIAFAQDESETNTEQELKQKNVGSGDSTNNNCGENLIKASGDIECFNEEEEVIDQVLTSTPFP
jgi:hypothetical protein